MSSVVKSNRTPGQLEVNTMALDLCCYTLHITSNPKHFPQDQSAFTERIRDNVIQIHAYCWVANNIYVGDSLSRYNTRIEYEAKAIDCCNTLMALIEIAQKMFHLESRRIRYWMKKTKDLRTVIYAWKESDVHRLKPGR